MDDLLSFLPRGSIGPGFALGFLAVTSFYLIGQRIVRSRKRHPYSLANPLVDPFLLFVTERRNRMRQGGRRLEVLVATDDTSSAPAQAWVLNRTADGLGLVLPYRVRAGAVLLLRRLNSPPSAPWVQIQVKHCRRQDKVWLLGGQFVETPPRERVLFN